MAVKILKIHSCFDMENLAELAFKEEKPNRKHMLCEKQQMENTCCIISASDKQV